jgi:hypothetical protein
MQQPCLSLRTPENPDKNPEISDFPETLEISPETPGLLLKSRKKLRN